MKKLLIIITIIPSIAFSQGYCTAGYAGSLSHKKLSSGISFGAGYQMDRYSAGFIVEGLGIGGNDFGVAGGDLRIYNGKTFLSFQPGKILYDKDGVKGTYSYAGMAGVNLSLFTISAGYQNTGFKYLGKESRAGTFKFSAGITLH